MLDHGEGRGECYRLAWVHAPVTLADGTRHEWVLAYLTRPEVVGQHLNRSPLLLDGEPVRVSNVGHAEARDLTGQLANSDGLESIDVDGEPSPADLHRSGA